MWIADVPYQQFRWGGVRPDPTPTDNFLDWDERRWYPDTSSPNEAKNDVMGIISEDKQFIYFEFSKPLKFR